MLNFLKKITGSKKEESFFKGFEWDSIIVVDYIDKETELSESIILDGNHKTNIYLNENVHIWVRGNIEGAIVGHSKNMVKVTGKVNGFISTYFLDCTKGCEIKGAISTSELKIEPGINFEAITIPIDQTKHLKYLGLNKTNIFKSSQFIEIINTLK